jgi:hypothetical protein
LDLVFSDQGSATVAVMFGVRLKFSLVRTPTSVPNRSPNQLV